ncbi:MAG: type II toxin-antitoxin system Phd/YefM family antitoxin [Bdellovibrionales bacterium]
MDIYTASEARSKLYNLIDYVADSHEPIHVKGKRNQAVLISEEDFAAMQETLYLMSIPGMRESIQKGRAEDIKKCAIKLPW